MCKDFTRAIAYQSLLVSFYNALQQFGTVQVPKRGMKRRGKKKKKKRKEFRHQLSFRKLLCATTTCIDVKKVPNQ